MKLEDIKNLASLVRLDMNENEMEEIASSFDSILSYVGAIQEVSNTDTKTNYILKNVMRDDVVSNEQGMYTDSIIANMPESQDGYLKVKQIL